MMCYRDRAFCSDHDQCATMDCDRRLTTKDDEYLTANHWMPVEWMSLADLCGKYEVKG
jgi:hypothetical protein